MRDWWTRPRLPAGRARNASALGQGGRVALAGQLPQRGVLKDQAAAAVAKRRLAHHIEHRHRLHQGVLGIKAVSSTPTATLRARRRRSASIVIGRSGNGQMDTSSPDQAA